MGRLRRLLRLRERPAESEHWHIEWRAVGDAFGGGLTGSPGDVEDAIGSLTKAASPAVRPLVEPSACFSSAATDASGYGRGSNGPLAVYVTRPLTGEELRV